MLILGADLSYTRSGLVMLDSHYKVTRAIAHGFPPGPRRLYRAMVWFTNYLGRPDLCIIEDQAYGSPSRIIVAKLAELQGVFKATLETFEIDYLLVSPTAIKKHITGKGTAEKEVVARELKRLHSISFKNDPGCDLSDAAAAACWGVAHLAKKTN